MFKSYPKIEGLFKRKDGSKELDINEYRNPCFEYLGCTEWIATEKIDGTNVCVEWDGHEFHFWGHTEKATLHDELLTYLERIFDDVMEEKVEELFGEKCVNFYGEGYGAGIQKGSGYSDEKKFILFDIYKPETGNWMNFYDMQDIGEKLGLEVVPTVDVLGIRDDDPDYNIEFGAKLIGDAFLPSIIYVLDDHKTRVGKKEQNIEGIVLRPKYELKDNRGQRIICKIKCSDFQPIKNQIVRESCMETFNGD